MRRFMLASVVVLMGGVCHANPRLVFIKMTFPAGGDTTYRLERNGVSYSDPTCRIEYYQKAGVWTLRSTFDGDVIWTKAVDPLELGGGFTVQSNTAKNGAPSVSIVQTVE
jgi:hypothetical protein